MFQDSTESYPLPSILYPVSIHVIFVKPGHQAFYPESQLNKKSSLHTFSGFARILLNHITWPNYMTIFLFKLSIPPQLVQLNVFFYRLTTLHSPIMMNSLFMIYNISNSFFLFYKVKNINIKL